MNGVWSRDPVRRPCNPSTAGNSAGTRSVAASGVAAIASGGEIKRKDQLIQVAGDMAYEVGIETGTLTLGGLKASIEHRATNIYRRESGAWKLVHHHTVLAPAMMDVLARLQGKT
jgi:ketosteroid isomerase-like protein